MAFNTSIEKDRINKEQRTSKSCGKGYGSNETKTMNMENNFETGDLKEVITKIKWTTETMTSSILYKM